MIDLLINKVKSFNEWVDYEISTFLKPYFDLRPEGFFTSHLLLFIKIILILSIFAVPIAFLKLLHPYDGTLTKILVILIILDALLGFSVFLGFLQLLY